MPLIQLPKQFQAGWSYPNKKPAVRTKIDPSHPWSKNLLAATIFSEANGFLREEVSGNSFTIGGAGNLVKASTTHGLGYDSTTGNSPQATVPVVNNIGTGPATVSAIIKTPSVFGDTHCFGLDRFIIMTNNSAAGNEWCFYDGQVRPSGYILEPDTVYILTAVRQLYGSYRLYTNGVLTGTTSNAAVSQILPKLHINSHTGAGDYGSSTVIAGYVFDREFYSAEVRSLSDDFYQIMAPADEVGYFHELVIPPIEGSISTTESGEDALSSSGNVHTTGSLAVTEVTSDGFTASGSVPVLGSLSIAEAGSDSITLSGNVPVTGTILSQESSTDSVAVNGVIPTAGSISITEIGSDGFTASGKIPSAGILVAQESSTDVISSTGVVPPIIIGSMSASESGSDTFIAIHPSLITTTGDVAMSYPLTSLSINFSSRF